jgi:pre-rRNA-processing protein IPI3
MDRLESEVRNLREQLGKAKSINDAMWETMLQNAVAETKAGTIK